MEKVDALFIVPGVAQMVFQSLSQDLSAIEPPLWAGLLAGHVRKTGKTAALLDADALRVGIAEAVKLAGQYDPKLQIVMVYGQQPSASTQNMHGASLLCRELKNAFPNRKILLVGGQPGDAGAGRLERLIGRLAELQDWSPGSLERVYRELVDELGTATERLKGETKKRSHKARNRVILLTGVTLGVLYNPWTGPSTREWIMDRVAGGNGDGFQEFGQEAAESVADAAKDTAES